MNNRDGSGAFVRLLLMIGGSVVFLYLLWQTFDSGTDSVATNIVFIMLGWAVFLWIANNLFLSANDRRSRGHNNHFIDMLFQGCAFGGADAHWRCSVLSGKRRI